MGDPTEFLNFKLVPLPNLQSLHPDIIYSELISINPIYFRANSSAISRISRITKLYLVDGDEVLMFENSVITKSSKKNIRVFTSAMNLSILLQLSPMLISIKQSKQGKNIITARIRDKCVPSERFKFKLTVQDVLNQYKEESK